MHYGEYVDTEVAVDVLLPVAKPKNQEDRKEREKLRESYARFIAAQNLRYQRCNCPSKQMWKSTYSSKFQEARVLRFRFVETLKNHRFIHVDESKLAGNKRPAIHVANHSADVPQTSAHATEKQVTTNKRPRDETSPLAHAGEQDGGDAAYIVQGTSSADDDSNAAASAQGTISHATDLAVPAISMANAVYGQEELSSPDVKNCVAEFMATIGNCSVISAFLHYFFDREKEKLEGFFLQRGPIEKQQARFKRIDHCMILTLRHGDFKNGQHTELPGTLRKSHTENTVKIIKSCLPHETLHLNDVKQVLNYCVKLFMDDDDVSLMVWDMEYQNHCHLPDMEFFDLVETFFDQPPIELHNIAASASVAIFFRLPTWRAQLVLFMIKYFPSLQEPLLVLGYRSFAQIAYIQVTEGGGGKRGQGGGGQETLICAYNIRDIGETALGIDSNVVGPVFSQQQRDLADKVVCVCVRACVRACVCAGLCVLVYGCVCVCGRV